VKYLRYVPNADHSLRGSDAWTTLIACYSAILKGSKLPRFSWTVEADGVIRVKTQDQADEVKLWQATNPEARDFRLDTIHAAYTSSALQDQGRGVYASKVEKPAKGWTAYFVELTYKNGAAAPFKFTTEVRVTPDVTPHKYKQPTPPR
jgi:PhoPQ-activated pathogenicity-related protein